MATKRTYMSHTGHVVHVNKNHEFMSHSGAVISEQNLTLLAPNIESSTDINEVETTSFTVTKPFGLAVDDLLLLVCAKDDDPIIDLPAGWTRATASTAGVDYGTDVLYKIADSGDVAATNFTFTGDSEEYCGRLYRISNVDTTTPIDVQDATGNTGTSTSPIANEVTTVTNDALVFAYAGMDERDQPYTLDTAGWREDFNSISSATAGSCGIVIGTKVLTTAAVTGNCAFTTNASDGWAACQFAIRPIVEAAGGFEAAWARNINVLIGVNQ